MRPEAEEYVGKYVRAVHSFDSSLSGELTLCKGDILKVTSYVDQNWLTGKLGEKEGSFPKDFVEKIHLPHTGPNQKVFAAIENFSAQQTGDLGLQKGDVIIGLHPVDEFWWEGESNTVTGIFPITHVVEIEIPTLLRDRSRSVHSSEPLFAQALVDAVAQLDEELSFQAGDIIKVTEVIDEDWYQGECHGKSGMFLTSCVQLLNENECIESGQTADASPHSQVTQPERDHSYHMTGKPNDQGSNSSHQTTLSTQSSMDLESASGAGVKTEPARYSKDNVEMENVQVSEKSVERGNSYSDTVAGVTPYARTLYPFVGENPDELSFDPNDIVTLIQHVDEQWIEGEIDGQIGLFPASFVEIVVDCPYAYTTEQTSDLQADQSVNVIEQQTPTVDENSKITSDIPANDDELNSTHRAEDTFALVLHSFVSETPQDLSVSEGETLSVIRKIDDNWILVENETGQQGMCPLSFVDIIGDMPKCPTQASCDSNANEIKSKGDDTAIPSGITTDKTLHNMVKGEDEGRSESVQVKPSDTSEKNQAVNSLPKTKSLNNQKPKLKPKPALAPKPVIKPKPLLTPKPFASNEGSFKPVKFNVPTLPKSVSTRSLSTVEHNQDQSVTMPKSQSMSEINNGQSQSENGLCEIKDDTLGSSSSLESNKRDSGGKKAFEDWDLSRPLDSLIKTEFVRAKQDAESKSRTNSHRSSGSGVDFTDKAIVSDEAQKRRMAYQGNYSRENFDLVDTDAYSVGNSIFFVNNFAPSDKKLRKPPLPQSIKQDFTRRPSLKRAAPPRPTGPRIPPSPSRTPMVPSRVAPAVPNPMQGSVQMRDAPSRPQSGPRRHMRPAPPRPQGLSRKGTPPRPPKDNNLMRFSPPEPTNVTQELQDEDNEDDDETVQELKDRLSGLMKDLEGFKKNKEAITLAGQNGGGDTEIHENLSFYDDNIQGITAEIDQLKENLAQISPRERSRMEQEKAAIQQKLEEEKYREAQRQKLEEEKEERREKRIKVINELIQTERDFIASLSLIMDTFLGPDVEKHPDVDLKQLFGNIDEVADVSQRLLTKLEDATCNKDFSEQVIGTSFIALSEDMKDVYAPYCRNHDDVISLIEKYKQNTEIKAYLEMLLDKLREVHTVFDLEALLIKPVQRVLKYPLLLNALSKATEEDHMDRTEVIKAINCMTDVATAINEYKRRKDLVYKYKKKETEAFGEKLSKLSLHSIMKKSSRIRGRFSANLGLSDFTRDPLFEKEETMYRHLEKAIKMFIKDVQLYLQEVQEVVNVMETLAADVEDYYGEQRHRDEVKTYQAFHNQVQMKHLPNFKMEVDDLVISPLSQLSQMFEGPNKVIQKRYDKLLDYDNMKRKAQSDRVTEKAVQIAKQDYEALNAQLMDDLPRLYALAFQLFQDCVASFVRAQREYQNGILQDTYQILELQFLDDDSIMETFNIQNTAIVDKLAFLSFMPKTFSQRVADMKAEKKAKRMSLDPSLLRSNDVVPQIDSQRVLILQLYAKDKLYRVTETFIALDTTDVSVSDGDVVGVVMEKDPMGNKERWFVDNGAIKGFVPKRVLTLYESSPPRRESMPGRLCDGISYTDGHMTIGEEPSSSSNSLLEGPGDGDDMVAFGLDEDMTPEVPETVDEDIQLYYAEYPFTARNGNEVSLFEHQVVNVLAKHDQEGNTEWWYVEADGRYGYTPAIYLKEMDTVECPS